jgi:chemotaxis signal transduction protein
VIAPTGLAERLATLREAFDRSFIEPPRDQVALAADLLAIRVANRRYVLRLTDTDGVFPDRPIMPLPGPVPALLGLAGFRRTIVPVYDLGAVLRVPPVADRTSLRWLVLHAGTPPVAVAFSDLDGHVRVPADAVIPEASEDAARGCLSGMVRLPDGPRPIVDLGAVRAAIQTMTSLHGRDGGTQ